MSRTKQLATSGRLLCNNSGADPNTSTRKPTDRKRLLSEFRIEASSSTTKTTGLDAGASVIIRYRNSMPVLPAGEMSSAPCQAITSGHHRRQRNTRPYRLADTRHRCFLTAAGDSVGAQCTQGLLDTTSLSNGLLITVLLRLRLRRLGAGGAQFGQNCGREYCRPDGGSVGRW